MQMMIAYLLFHDSCWLGAELHFRSVEDVVRWNLFLHGSSLDNAVAISFDAVDCGMAL